MGTGIRPPGSNSGSGSVRTFIPTSWVVGAIGPQLGLSLVQSIVIMAVGQAAGALIFGVFTLMGKRTGVSQFALGPDGIRPARQQHSVDHQRADYPGLDWGCNTYIVLGLATVLPAQARAAEQPHHRVQRRRADHVHPVDHRDAWLLRDPHVREVDRSGAGCRDGGDDGAGVQRRGTLSGTTRPFTEPGSSQPRAGS